MKKYSYLRRTAISSVLLAAYILAATVISIPLPGGFGYLNFGDAVGFLAAATVGPLGIFVGALGAAFCDLILGFVVYAPVSACIRLISAGIIRFLLSRRKKHPLAAFLLASVPVPVGYFLYECRLFGASAALLNLLPNLMQGAVSALAAWLFLRKINQNIRKEYFL